MSSRTPPPPPTTSASVAAKPAAKIIKPRERKQLCPWMVLNAIEGFGKTTIGAYAPDPLILMARGETGYDTLLTAGLVPQIPAEEVESWSDALAWLDAIIDDPQGRKTLVLDAIDGFERLCHEHVCQRDFNGDWGERGFASYQKGYDMSVTEWLKLLSRLDRLRTRHGLIVLMLSHCKVATVKNPLGADYDRFVPDLHHKTWAATARQADAVLFGTFHSIVEQDRAGKVKGVMGKGKGIGGAERVIYTQHRDAFDAKNRFRLPEEIWLSDDAAESWNTIWNAISGAA